MSILNEKRFKKVEQNSNLSTFTIQILNFSKNKFNDIGHQLK
jgi:hypothetical protein